MLYRTGLPRHTYKRTLFAMAAIAAIGVVLVITSREDATAAGAYLAFLGAIAIWGLIEVSYLLGIVTGPRPRACPAGVSAWARFSYGVKACLYHEMSILASAGLLAALTWQAPNQVAIGTFVVVWLMRWSTKLNIFLGVRNLHSEYWPGHLQYLQSYARVRPMNVLFPISIAIAMTIVVALAGFAIGAEQSPYMRTAAMLLVTILSLAMLEHVFLMLRLPDDALWRLGTRARDG
jgi:putative photosynthetic complex assembly protein 2